MNETLDSSLGNVLCGRTSCKRRLSGNSPAPVLGRPVGGGLRTVWYSLTPPIFPPTQSLARF